MIFNANAEQSVLGALLIDNDAYDRLGNLKSEHFYRGDHRQIFSEICKTIEAGQPADVVTIGDRLPENISFVYLNELAANTPSSANTGRYAEMVRTAAQRRELAALASDLHDATQSTKDPAQVIDEAQTQLESIAEQRVKSEPVKAGDDMQRYIEEIEKRAEGNGVKAIPTGFTDLDERMVGGIRRGELWIVAARPKMGKAQPIWSKVLLANGKWKRIGDLKVGDEVASIDGLPSKVTGVFPQGRKQFYKVSLSDGRHTYSCGEHLWRVGNRKWKEDRIASLDEISAMLEKPSMQGRVYVPVFSGHFGTGSLPVRPYALGALIGNGGFSSESGIRFSSADAETLAHLEEDIPGVRLNNDGEYDYRVVTRVGNKSWLMDAIRSLGLMGKASYEKFIPEEYLQASRKDRQDLLQGLMDTDGWAEKKGCALFGTSSKQLALDVQSLARSLGYVVRLSAPRLKKLNHAGKKKAGRPFFVLSISGSNRSDLFRLPRKRERCGGKESRLNISSIEAAGFDDCVCISVSHPDRLYITDDYIVTHNTAFALNVALRAAQDYSVLVLSMEMPKDQIHDRNVATLGHIPLSHVIDPRKMHQNDWTGLVSAVERIGDLNLFIDDQGALRLIDVRMKAKQVKRRHGLDLLVIDYLQLMDGEGDNRNAQVEQITRGLKALAKELGIGIVLLSQLNRNLEQRPNKRPMPSDLRDSGAIEQDCDGALFLYRDEVYNPDSPDKGICEVNVGLIRQGEPGTVGLAYIGQQTRFESLERGRVFGQRAARVTKYRGLKD